MKTRLFPSHVLLAAGRGATMLDMAMPAFSS